MAAVGAEFQVLTVAEFQQALEKFGFQLAPEDWLADMAGFVWKWLVAHCTQWFCWSLSLWKMAISLGIYPIFLPWTISRCSRNYFFHFWRHFPWRIHGAGRKMLTWLGYIDGIFSTPYIAAPWILWALLRFSEINMFHEWVMPEGRWRENRAQNFIWQSHMGIQHFKIFQICSGFSNMFALSFFFHWGYVAGERPHP